MERNNSLLFIPDIGGFANFVESTEVSHSQHIISELHAAIIVQNELELTVSENEGDVILFFKQGNIPSIEEIVCQAEKMFLSFQEVLNDFVQRRICQCNACTTASELSLKFIVHSGDIAFITVKDQTKLHGPAVILAKKLLRNDLQEKDYILFTDKLLGDTDISEIKIPKKRILRSKVIYQDLGEIEFNYISFAEQKDIPSQLPQLPVGNKIVNPVKKWIDINQPINFVYDILSNFEYRLKWMEGVEDIRFDPNELNRIGTKHICVTQNREISYVTISNNSFGESKIVYGEKSNNAPIVRDMTTYYLLEKVEHGTKLTVEIHFLPRSWIGRLLIPFFKMEKAKNLTKSITRFKGLCDQIYLAQSSSVEDNLSEQF